jgi:hypothetical protein
LNLKRRKTMSTAHDARRGEARSAAASDDAIKLLTDILRQVGAGFQPPPLSPEAVKAIELYNKNRGTLDHSSKGQTTT